MRILGIDYGDRKTGIAISDPFGWTAQGLDTIREKKVEKVVEKVSEIIKKYDVEKIVVGFPKNMNGTVGPRGEKTILFIEELNKVFKKEIIKWDERLTTTAAEAYLISTDMRRDKRKEVVDTVAATFILESYLRFLSNSNSKNE